MSASLLPHNQANEFANALTRLLNATVSHGVQLLTWPDGQSNFWITASDKPVSPTQPSYITLPNSPQINGKPAFGLKILYLVTLDETSNRLVVAKSWTAVFSIHAQPRPIIRWEYIRNGGGEPGVPSQRKQKRQAAHVHVHGQSDELSEIEFLTVAKSKKPISGALEKLHFPVGGRRFRPSIEDILEFLNAQHFVSRFHDGGAAILEESREKWLRVQLKAAISDDVDTTVEALRELGFEIQPPRTI